MNKDYRVIFITLPILLIISILGYSTVNIFKDLMSGTVFVLLNFISFFSINLLLIGNFIILIIQCIIKSENIIIIFFGISVLIITTLFYYYGNDYITEIFNDRVIKDKLTKTFGNKYKIISKKKANNEFIYDVTLNDNNLIFNNKVYFDDTCGMFKICNDYYLYTNYAAKYFNYYLEEFNLTTNSNLKLENSLKLDHYTEEVYSTFKCESRNNCINNYLNLISFKKYLLNKNININNYYINFYNINKITNYKLSDLNDENINIIEGK